MTNQEQRLTLLLTLMMSLKGYDFYHTVKTNGQGQGTLGT